MVRHSFRVFLGPLLAGSAFLFSGMFTPPVKAKEPSQGAPKPSILFKIQNPSERLETTVNTSRHLVMDQKIPQAQVNNPDILEIAVLSPTTIQVSAKKAGVTQVNLWGEDEQIYTVDVIVHGDAQELTMLLRSQFPTAAIKVIPIANGVLISGYVDHPEHVSRIIEIAEEYYPKVIKNITVGGVQQVLLHVKVMEVSRTKLRALGFDFAKLTGNDIVASGVSGLLATMTSGSAGSAGTSGSSLVGTTGTDHTFSFQVLNGSSAFFGVLEAMRNDQLMKVLAEPTLVTVSGRPAFFNVGGEFPILVPQSLGTVSIEFKRFGTQVDFVPIVLGNGRIRLEVRPRVSEIDNTRSVEIDSTTVPGLRVREVDTGVEMEAGQTLAIAGLVQNRVEAQRKGLPWVSDMPYLGALFRKVEEHNNEIELLMLVTPELIDAVDANQVPPCGPGMQTDSPTDWQLYLQGHIEVPRCCPAGGNSGCESCDFQEAGGPGQTMRMPVDGMITNETERIQAPGPAVPTPPPSKQNRPDTSRGGGQNPPTVARNMISRNPHNPPNRHIAPAVSRSGRDDRLPGFIGPIGYDVVK